MQYIVSLTTSPPNDLNHDVDASARFGRQPGSFESCSASIVTEAWLSRNPRQLRWNVHKERAPDTGATQFSWHFVEREHEYDTKCERNQ